MRIISRISIEQENELTSILDPIIKNRNVQQMRGFIQHGDTSCYLHSYKVAVYSYQICKALGLDYEKAARGAMLHDFFLYSWKEEFMKGREHLWFHPSVSLENASREFDLSDMEKDIIEKHMWPVTHRLPKYKESFVVSLADKISAVAEAAEYVAGRLKTTKYRYTILAKRCLTYWKLNTNMIY